MKNFRSKIQSIFGVLCIAVFLFFTSCNESTENPVTPATNASNSLSLEDIQDSVTAPASRSPIEARVNVRNTSNAAKSVKIRRYEIDVVEGAENSICWGGKCYPPKFTVTSEFQVIVPAGVDTTFKADYLPKGFVGVSKYLYVFFDKDNPSDSIGVNITFRAE